MIGKSLAHSQNGKESIGKIKSPKPNMLKRNLASSFKQLFRLGLIMCMLLSVLSLNLTAQESAKTGTTYVQTRQTSETGPCRSAVKIYSYTRTGSREATFIEPGIYCQIELAPNDRYLLVERKNEYAGGPAGSSSYDLWLADLKSQTFTRWVSSPADYPRDPVWSPDSSRIGYRVWADQQLCELHTTALGSDSTEVLAENSETTFPDDWTPDGKFLLYHTDDPDTVALQPVTPNQRPKIILEELGGRNSMRVSPDGKWIAYGSNESGNWEIYSAAFPSFENKHRVTDGGAVQVRWRQDSKEYYYLDSSSRLMAQGFDPATGKENGKARALFQTNVPPAFQVYFYAVNNNGTKFFFVETETDVTKTK